MADQKNNVKRVSALTNYQDSLPEAQKPEDFKGQELILHSFTRERGKMGFYFYMECEIVGQVDPETGQNERVTISSGATFLQNLFGTLNPKDLPFQFQFAWKGNSLYMV